MPTKDLHEKPFDETTLTKLKLFEEYAKAWIPTFVMQSWVSEIWIFDFFAGTGRDKNGVLGSPLRILEQVRGQIKHIKTPIRIVFNEYKTEKCELLKACVCEFLNLPENEELLNVYNSNLIQIIYECGEIEFVFGKWYSRMQKHPSLVYMDQNGVRFLTRRYIDAFSQCHRLDFLYFNSSSFYKRFGSEKGFKDIDLNIDVGAISSAPSEKAHVVFVEELRNAFSATDLKFYPFSLKKRGTSNVYGVIFGAKHLRAVDKFLTAAWSINDENGCANYDIDEQNSLDLFSQNLTKIEKFKNQLKKEILTGKITNNHDALHYAYAHGHPSTHASECVKEMKKEGCLMFGGKSPKIRYEYVLGNRKEIVNFDILIKGNS